MGEQDLFSTNSILKIEDYYTITNKELGHGSDGIVVNVGVDLSNNRRVAIKCVDKQLVELYPLNNLEITKLKNIHHPHIVPMIAIFDTDKNLYIVMELMEGGNLYDEIIRRTSFNEGDASYIMRQLVEALEYLHREGIIHRDLKIENILLVKKDCLEIKLGDIGINKMKTESWSPFYFAPEMILGIGYGTEVDMWAAGVILYVLLSGRLPFVSSEGNIQLYKMIVGGELVFKSPQFDTVSDQAKDLISKLIVGENRFNARQVLDHPFIRVIQNQNEPRMTSTFKIFFSQDNIRRLKFSKLPSYEEFIDQLKEINPDFFCVGRKFLIKYVDSDEDNISVSSQIEWDEMISHIGSSGDFRVHVESVEEPYVVKEDVNVV